MHVVGVEEPPRREHEPDAVRLTVGRGENAAGLVDRELAVRFDQNALAVTVVHRYADAGGADANRIVAEDLVRFLGYPQDEIEFWMAKIKKSKEIKDRYHIRKRKTE